MTGSDWREYELFYTGEAESQHERKGDIGYVVLSRFFYKLIPDFWLFTAIFKIIYLWSLVEFIRCFYKQAYIVVGLAFAGSLLFMIIDCPFRFMIALSAIHFGIVFWLRKKRVFAIAMFLFAPTVHMAVFFVMMLILTFPFAKAFSCVNRFLIYLLYLVLLVAVFETPIFSFLFNNIVPIVGENRFENYEEVEAVHILSLGTIKFALLLLIILYYRDTILKEKFGLFVYYFAVISILLQPIVMCVPTAFRINIINDEFMWIALAYLISQQRQDTMRKMVMYGLIVLCLILISKECITNWRYTPYSNSITYIVSKDHLPYSKRYSYNPIYHDKEYWH
jgi:hypothetical protein